MPDIESLYVSSIDVKPIGIDWSEVDVDELQFWEAFDYEFAGRTYTLIASGSVTVALVEDDQVWESWDEYEDYYWDDDLDGGLPEDCLDERSWDILMQVEPYVHGAEGPMMNYWYPAPDLTPTEAAAKLRDLPLCVVEVNGSYGLALTGGGMDLSWDICKAFVLLGYLPPVHFADLPDMAGHWDEEVYEAMKRALTVQMRALQHRLDRLENLRAKKQEGD